MGPLGPCVEFIEYQGLTGLDMNGYGVLLTLHIFTPYIIRPYKFSLLQQKRLLVWRGVHGSM